MWAYKKICHRQQKPQDGSFLEHRITFQPLPACPEQEWPLLVQRLPTGTCAFLDGATPVDLQLHRGALRFGALLPNS